MKNNLLWHCFRPFERIKKLLLIMKLSFVLMFVLVLQTSASIYSQNAKLDLSVSNMKVKEVLKLIETKSNFRFFYNDDLSELDKSLTISSKDGNVYDLLNQIFANSTIGYKVFDNNVVVIAPIVSLQQQQVSGTITDGATGEPLIGVSITVEGTAKGTVSDLKGNFSIEVPGPNSVLVFSYVGYVTEQITISNQSTIDIKLLPDIKKLEEIVVIGYGTVKKRDLTGSVSTVKSEDIVKAPTNNVMEAIQGKVPGMDIIRSSGAAGSNVNILIRGTRSLDIFNNGTNNPLVIIDGVQLQSQDKSFADLNTNDVESIEVLKDASSTAIYGHQGAGGVIIITTKKAKAGKTKVSYNGYYGVNGLTDYPYGRLGDDYIALRREAYKANNTYTTDQAMFTTQEWNAIQAGQWVNWDKLLLSNGSLENHQVSVSGGNEKTTSYLSAGYYKEVGAIKDNYTRYNGRLNVDHNINKWAKAGMQLQLTYTNQNKRTDPFGTANSISPLGVPYDQYGNINVYPIARDNSSISPLTDLRLNAAVDNVTGTRVFSNGYFEIAPIKGLTIRSNLGVNLQYSREGVFNDSLSIAQASSGINDASVTNNNSRRVIWDNVLTFSREIGHHSFTLTALTSYSHDVSESFYEDGKRQLFSNQSFYALGSTSTAYLRAITSVYKMEEDMSYGGRINYSYLGRYLLTVTDRWDGSSVLSPGHKWSSFPSAAFAWRAKDESFMKNIDKLSELKLRVSYGVAGNATIPPYSTQSGVYAVTNMSFGDNPASAYSFIQYLSNSELTWERSTTTDIGVDLGIFKNRLSATVDYYNTNTDNVLLPRALPISTGGTTSKTTFTIYQNLGSTLNRGIEIAINSVNIDTKNFRWTTSLTFSSNKEKITSLINGIDLIAYNGQSAEEHSLLIGHPINSIYTYRKLGIWQTGDSLAMRAFKTKFKPGDIKLADLNGDSIIDSNDRTYIGAKVPRWEGGLENKFYFKGFDLSIYLFARWGQMINDNLLGRYNPSGTGNGPAFIDYWTPTNPTNDFPRPMQGSILSNYLGYQTLYYVDGSYFKIKNISFGYTLPSKISRKIFIDKLRMYVTASNILTVAKSPLVKNYDPENSGSETFPMSKQIIVGVNVDF